MYMTSSFVNPATDDNTKPAHCLASETMAGLGKPWVRKQHIDSQDRGELIPNVKHI